MKYYKFEINMVLANILALILLILGFIFLFAFIPGFEINKIYLSLLLVYLILHEICHGIGFGLFGGFGNIKYGAKLESGVLYALCQKEISKIGIIISLLIPIIVLTIICGLIGYIYNIYYLLVLAVINFSSAAGDIIMTIFSMKLPKDTKYIDYDLSIGAYYLSNEDLSTYSNKFMKFVESGSSKKSANIKKITISKPSIYWFLGMIIYDIIMIIL